VPLALLLNTSALASSLWQRRELIWQFTRRELVARNRGSQLGLAWNILHPFIMLAVYTFVFAVVWKARWGDGPAESPWTFALAAFCGLILLEIFSATVGAAPMLIIWNPGFVKKVIFPLEILPIATLGCALILSLIGFIVIVAGNLFLSGRVSATLYLFPLVLLPLLMLTMGVSWLVASLGVFLRDIKQVVTVCLQILIFVTPIFYPLHRVPEGFRAVLQYNPFAALVDGARCTLLWGRQPDWPSLILVGAIGLIAMQLGYAFFMKSKRGFADVL
jgi:lipopolysaccharide transport system permease protein